MADAFNGERKVVAAGGRGFSLAAKAPLRAALAAEDR
jgi:hypothetical protein